jgi:hypothetical protein
LVFICDSQLFSIDRAHLRLGFCTVCSRKVPLVSSHLSLFCSHKDGKKMGRSHISVTARPTCAIQGPCCYNGYPPKAARPGKGSQLLRLSTAGIPSSHGQSQENLVPVSATIKAKKEMNFSSVWNGGNAQGSNSGIYGNAPSLFCNHLINV